MVEACGEVRHLKAAKQQQEDQLTVAELQADGTNPAVRHASQNRHLVFNVAEEDWSAGVGCAADVRFDGQVLGSDGGR